MITVWYIQLDMDNSTVYFKYNYIWRQINEQKQQLLELYWDSTFPSKNNIELASLKT